MRYLGRGSAAPDNESEDEANQEYKKQNSRDLAGQAGYAAETQSGGDNGYDEEYEGVSEHGICRE